VSSDDGVTWIVALYRLEALYRLVSPCIALYRLEALKQKGKHTPV